MASRPSYEALEKRVQALEAALYERETVLDHLPDLVVIQDLDHKIHWANQAACQFLGRDREELRKARCHELWNFSAEPCADCPMPRCVENRGLEIAEKTTPDGRTWRVRCAPLPDDQGEIRRVLQVREDITETVRLRKAHERAKQHRRLILDTMQEVLVFYDTDLRLKWANQAAADLATDTVENLLDRQCYEIWHGRTAPCENCPALRAMESGQPRQGELFFADGGFYQLRAYPVYDGNGKLIGTVEYGFDITEIKRTQLELAESLNKYQVLFEAANDAIFVACAQTGIVLDANQKAEALIGRPRSEIIGMHQSQLHPPEQETAAKTNFQNDAEGRGKPAYHDIDLLDRQGRKIAVEISASFIEMGGRPCILGIFRDVSEQRKAQAALRQYEALVNAVTDPASYVDRQYIYRIVSEAYTRNYCKPKEAIIGHPVWELMGKEQFETTIRPRLDLCFAGETVSYSSWFIFANGTRKYMETCYYPVFDADGETVLGASVFARDRTARKMTENALKESEARFRAIFQNEYVVMLIIDPDTGAIWDANPAAVRYYGWSHDELTAMNIKQINTLRPEAVAREMQNAYQKERKYFDFRHRLKDGTLRDVEVSSGPVEFGGRTFLFSIVRDVTERKQAEEALKKSERKFRNIAENIPGLVLKYKINPDGSDALLYISKGVEDIYEISRQDVFNNVQLLWKRIHPDDLPGYIESIKQSAENLAFWETEHRIALPDGRVKWIHDRGVPNREADGSIVWDTMGIDITERKQAEKALKESEEKYRLLAENVEDVIWILDAELTHYTYISPSIQRLLGYSPEEFMAKPVGTYIAPEYFEAIQNAVSQRLKNERSGQRDDTIRRWESQYMRKTGETVFIESITRPMRGERGKFQGLLGVSRDITHRKNIENSLKKNEQRLQTLFKTISDAVYVHDLNGRIFDFNDVACERLGYTREEMMKLHVSDIDLDHKNKKSVSEKILPAMSSPILFESRHRTKDGGMIHVELTINTFSQNEDVLFVTVARDITERKQAEAALAESKARYYAIFEQAAVGITVASPDGQFLESNAAMCEMLGYTPEEMLGLTVFDINCSQDMERQRVLIQEVLDGKRDKFHIEKRYIHKNGHLVWVHHSSNVVRNKSGAVEYAIGASVNITERKQAEAALKESEARFRAIFEQASAGIAVAVMPSTRIVEANQALTDMLGYSREELRRFTVADITWPEDLELELSSVQPILENKADTFNLEKRFLHKNGQPVWANLSSTGVRDENGDIRYAIGVAVDISQRKQAEAALKAALEEKEVLLREIHHRVKNNMQVIVSLLRMHSRRNEDPKLLRIFNECRDRIDAMSLIHEAMYQSEDLARIDLETYLKKLCANLSRAYADRGKGVWVTVERCQVALGMDQGIAVGMAVSELIANAFKHAFPGEEKGTVSVRLSCPDGETVELMVADNGIGLPAEIDIFNTRSIGLRLVSGAVTRDLGGTLVAENDGGARFIIRFQCQQPTA